MERPWFCEFIVARHVTRKCSTRVPRIPRLNGSRVLALRLVIKTRRNLMFPTLRGLWINKPPRSKVPCARAYSHNPLPCRGGVPSNFDKFRSSQLNTGRLSSYIRRVQGEERGKRFEGREMVMAGFRNYEGQTKTLSRRENNYQLLYSLIGRSRSFGKGWK